MKHFSPFLKTKLLTILFFLILKASYAQTIPVNEPEENLPLFFSAIKDSIPFDVNNFSAVQSITPGHNVYLNLGSSLIIDGPLISSSGKFNNSVLTFIVSLKGYIRTLFIFSKITLPAGKIIYRGRITSQASGDCFDMIEKNDHYYFIKKNINLLRAE